MSIVTATDRIPSLVDILSPGDEDQDAGSPASSIRLASSRHRTATEGIP